MAKHAHHYVVMLRKNGETCGCMGPYASLAAAKDEATSLPRVNPHGTECVVVRANSMRHALSVAQGNQMPDTYAPVRMNKGVEPLPARLPRSTVVQTLLFDSTFFNVGQAKSWAKRHGFRYGSVDTGGGRASFIRLRQVDPDTITAGTFRTIRFTDGIEAVIGMPKRKAKKNPDTTDLIAATIAPELVAAKAAAGLAARGVKAAGRGVASVAGEAGSALADIVAPKKRANGGPANAVITHTLREPEEGQADYTVTVRLERIGPVGHPRTYVNAEVVTQETGRAPVEQYDSRAEGVVSALGYLSRLSGSAKRTRFRKKIEREVAAARDVLLAGSR
jgi:hypothetical protein